MCERVSARESNKKCHTGLRVQSKSRYVWWQKYRFTYLIALQPFCKKRVSAQSFFFPRSVSLLPSPLLNTIHSECITRSWGTGKETGMNVVKRGWKNGEESALCQSWPTNRLPQKPSWEMFTVISQLPIEHHAAVTKTTDYHAHPLVVHARLKTVRIHTTSHTIGKSLVAIFWGWNHIFGCLQEHIHCALRKYEGIKQLNYLLVCNIIETGSGGSTENENSVRRIYNWGSVQDSFMNNSVWQRALDELIDRLHLR